MDDERQESSPLDEGSEMIAHSAQAAYAVSAELLLVWQPGLLWQGRLEH